MTKEIISTKNAPQAIGPYSQAVKAGNLMFISGQIPLDPETGDLVSQSIEDQAKQVLENVKSICEAAGYSLCLLYPSPSPRDRQKYAGPS